MKQPKPIQLSIPQPCHEDWALMTPDERGRFCSHCQKSVVDFTGWTDNQIYQYITAHAGERICGRVHITQTNRPLHPAIPLRKRPAAMRWMAAGLVLMLAMTPTQMKSMELNNIEIVCHANTNNTDDTTDNNKFRVKGVVLDETSQPIFGAIMEVFNGDTSIGGAASNKEGYFEIYPLIIDGFKNIRMKITYTSYDIKNIILTADNINIKHTIKLDLKREILLGLMEIPINAYKVPLIDPFEPTKQTITSEEIEKMAR